MTKKTMTVNEFSTKYGHDVRTVRRRINSFGIKPSGKKGIFAVYDSETLGVVMIEGDAGRAKADSSTQAEARTRLLELQGKKIAHQLAVANRQYIAVADVQKAIGDMILEAKKVLLSGPSSLAPQIVGVTIPEAELLLREWLHDALSRLAANPTGNKSSK